MRNTNLQEFTRVNILESLSEVMYTNRKSVGVLKDIVYKFVTA